MSLAFQRRPTDFDAPDFKARENAYCEFVDAFDHTLQPDLYTYFGWDPFHDGPIDALHYDARERTLTLRVMHPNLRHRDGTYANAWFRCYFSGVALCAAETQAGAPSPLLDGVTPDGLEFNISELNTLLDTGGQPNGPARFSLIIEAREDHGWGQVHHLGVVFQTLRVEPEDAPALRSMQESGEWDLCLYEPGWRPWLDE